MNASFANSVESRQHLGVAEIFRVFIKRKGDPRKNNLRLIWWLACLVADEVVSGGVNRCATKELVNAMYD